MAASEMLRRFSVLRSTDFDEAHEILTEVLTPHEIEPVDGTRSLDARASLAPLASSSLLFLGYGARVRVTPDLGEDRYLVVLPIMGGALVAAGDHRVVLQTGLRGAILSPGRAPTITPDVQCAALVWKFGRPAIDRFLRLFLGREPRCPLTFDPELDLREGAMAFWSRTLRAGAEEIDREGRALRPGPESRAFEEMLVAGLVCGQPNSYQDAFAREAGSVAPRAVRRVEEFVAGQVHADCISLQMLAAVAGVSGRTLDKSFRQFRNTTPMTYVRELRMERVRADLLEAAPDATVTEILTRWGVTQFGRFAGAYRRRYGETPRDTLRRNR
jgi:AraC-like DNA-binding protein